MKIDFDFRSDITVCELIQFLNDELNNYARDTDATLKYNFGHDYIGLRIEKENKLIDLIGDICMYANFADR